MKLTTALLVLSLLLCFAAFSESLIVSTNQTRSETFTVQNWCRRFPGVHKHQQLEVFARQGKLFAICGSCGDEIPLVRYFGTNSIQATLDNISKLP